jgi:hypothetical protein
MLCREVQMDRALHCMQMQVVVRQAHATRERIGAVPYGRYSPRYGDIASCMADACAGIWACNLIDGFWPAGATISTLQSGQVGVAALHSARSLLLHCTCRRSLLLQNHHDLETWRLPWHDSFQFFSSYPCRRQFHLAAA